MKSIIRSLIASAAIIAAISLAPATAPAYMGHDGPSHGGRHFKKMARELGLSEQQNQQIKDIFQKNKPQVEPLMKQLSSERRAMRSLTHAETLDEAAIRAQAAKIAAVQADMAVEQARAAQEVRKVLTPEQAQKFKTLQARRDQMADRKADQMPCGDCGDCPKKRKGQGR